MTRVAAAVAAAVRLCSVLRTCRKDSLQGAVGVLRVLVTWWHVLSSVTTTPAHASRDCSCLTLTCHSQHQRCPSTPCSHVVHVDCLSAPGCAAAHPAAAAPMLLLQLVRRSWCKVTPACPGSMDGGAHIGPEQPMQDSCQESPELGCQAHLRNRQRSLTLTPATTQSFSRTPVLNNPMFALLQISAWPQHLRIDASFPTVLLMSSTWKLSELSATGQQLYHRCSLALFLAALMDCLGACMGPIRAQPSNW